MNPAGKYRHYGAWHRKTRPYPKSTYGGQTDAGDVTVATLPFRVRPIRASEVQRYGKVAGELSHVLSTPYYSGAVFSSDDWIVIDGRVFRLTGPAVNVDEENVVFELACLETETAPV